MLPPSALRGEALGERSNECRLLLHLVPACHPTSAGLSTKACGQWPVSLCEPRSAARTAGAIVSALSCHSSKRCWRLCLSEACSLLLIPAIGSQFPSLVFSHGATRTWRFECLSSRCKRVASLSRQPPVPPRVARSRGRHSCDWPTRLGRRDLSYRYLHGCWSKSRLSACPLTLGEQTLRFTNPSRE